MKPKLKFYVASSWRNNIQPEVVRLLRANGHEAYDFKNPEPGNNGFHWTAIDPAWQSWTPVTFRAALSHPIAQSGYGFDWNAMQSADACVLVMPSGRSAHIEAGYFVGANKPLIILLAHGEPELMYKMATAIVTSFDELIIEVSKLHLPNT